MAQPNQIQMDYEAMEKAAQSFDTAANAYNKIVGQIHQCQETLQHCFSGSGGIAAQHSTDQLIQLLQQIKTRSEHMSSNIRDAVNAFRGGADPSAAQLFGKGDNNSTLKTIPVGSAPTKDAGKGKGNSKINRAVVGRIQNYSALIDQIAKEKGIDPNVVRGIIAAESGGNPDAGIGKSGYKGLMQAGYKTDQSVPEISIRTGIDKYLNGEKKISEAFNKYGVDTSKFTDDEKIRVNMIAYNTGPGVPIRAMSYAHNASNAQEWFNSEYFQQALVDHGSYSVSVFEHQRLSKLDGTSLATQYQELTGQSTEEISKRYITNGDWNKQELKKAIRKIFNDERSSAMDKNTSLKELDTYPAGRMIKDAVQIRQNNLNTWYPQRVIDYKNYFDNLTN